MLALRFYMNHTARVETSFEDLQTRFEDVMYKLELIYNTVSLPQVTTGADEAQAPRIPPTTTDEPPVSSTHTTHSHSLVCNPLHCLENCHCRCHNLSMQSLIPAKLASYIGQIYVSKRLLRAPWSTWSVCNVQTCRGDLRRTMTINWILPPSFLSGFLQSSRDRRIHLSIGAVRTIPLDAPILRAILDADVQRVHTLFALGQASIWDHTLHGNPILWVACKFWTLYPSKERYKIIQFLVSAGADALFLARPIGAYSAQDQIVFTLFQSLLEQPKMGQSLLTSIKSHPAAIDILCSVFNMDVIDALQDVLSRRFGYSDEDTAHLLTSLETTEYTMARSSVFDAIGYTPLQYAIRFSPSNVESLLAEGADAAAEPTLAYAARFGSIDLIELLIDKGADVNRKDSWGRTALHWACYLCYYVDFFELLQCAEDKIDWDVRTSEGQDALDLFDDGVASVSYGPFSVTNG
ncbi:ankyrin repeat-containing domain protein [Irpex lacteus]|nr:ankyrin repeat-containing domain protein [Irpex lacteus]